VIDRKNHKIEAIWPITMGKRNVAMALDEKAHRLFVGCRDGKLVILDTETGKEVLVLDIGGGVDDTSFDPLTGRVYAQCGKDGSTWIYQQNDGDRYERLQPVREGMNAKNSVLEPAMKRYFVIVPPAIGQGRIDVFATAGK
jgi:PQQ enzyme repeat